MASIVAERLIVRLERDGVVISGAHRPTSAWSEATGHLANCRRDDEIGEGGAIEARTRAFGRPPRWEQFLRYPALARFFLPPSTGALFLAPFGPLLGRGVFAPMPPRDRQPYGSEWGAPDRDGGGGWPVPVPEGVLVPALKPVMVTLSEGRQRSTRTCPT